VEHVFGDNNSLPFHEQMLDPLIEILRRNSLQRGPRILPARLLAAS
jgi:hypothetical protein